MLNNGLKIIHHPSSIIHHTSSVIHHLSSIIHHPPSFIFHPSSIIHHPSSVVHHPSSIISHFIDCLLPEQGWPEFPNLKIWTLQTDNRQQTLWRALLQRPPLRRWPNNWLFLQFTSFISTKGYQGPLSSYILAWDSLAQLQILYHTWLDS